MLALADASPEAILDNQAAIETYVSQMIRSTGKRNVDGRRLGGTPLGDAAVETIAAAKSGDKAGANAGVKKIVALTKLTKVAPLGTKENPFTGGVSFGSMSGTTGTPGAGIRHRLRGAVARARGAAAHRGGNPPPPRAA